MHEMKMLTNFYSGSMNGVAIMIENYRLPASALFNWSGPANLR